MDSGFKGAPCTRCNNKRGANCILQRLDRVLMNVEASEALPQFQVHHLRRFCLDARRWKFAVKVGSYFSQCGHIILRFIAHFREHGGFETSGFYFLQETDVPPRNS